MWGFGRGPKKNIIAGRSAETLENAKKKHQIRVLGRKVLLPRSLWMRRTIGGIFVFGGALGFLPVLGYWMIPVGLIILSNDSSKIRRLRRKMEVVIFRWWRSTRFARKSNNAQGDGKKAKVAVRVT